DYKSVLTYFENGVKTKGSILAVVSGNRPFEFMKSQKLRLAGFDGRLKNLDSEISPLLMPVVSDNWNNHFSWNGTGNLSLNEKNKLLSLVFKANSNDFILHFWGTPNKTEEQRTAIWKELSNAGVGLIGTDYLKELQQYLQTAN
ncbi:MAG: glycerophosphodiester phosphodiesterase, partial [Bacteroidetes bacterium]|nr:glycerophosphodiester phosphodiesterase [Bacteroidota bacterium]